MTKPTSNQDAFDRVARHLADQGRQAMRRAPRSTGKASCAYRGDGGCTCAIGSMIPDVIYDLRMEGARIMEAMHAHSALAEHFAGVAPHVLHALQGAHDKPTNWQSPSEMKSALRVVARNARLDPAILDTLDWSKLNRAA